MSIHLEFTDARFVFGGKSYPNIPLLVDSRRRFAEPLCEYLQHLVIFDHLRTSSAKTYAEYLLSFWRYLESNRLILQEICDYDLLKWLNLLEASGISVQTRAARCDAIFDFYVWMELNGYVNHSIRVPGWNDKEKFSPRLTSVSVKNIPKLRRSSKNGIISAIRPRAPVGGYQPTPTSDEVSRLYIAADKQENPNLTERNHLLIDWYVQVGLRRKEWSFLTKNQIPNWEAIYSLQQHGHAYELRLTKTKGDRIRDVAVMPELLEKTREYIEGPRATIVARFSHTRKGIYHEPEEVFLSHKTGKPLTLTAISNLLTHWFNEANVDGHGHRLRATYLTNLLDAEIEEQISRIAADPGIKIQIDYELILIKVAERAGHVNIDSLRPYLTLVKKQRIREPKTADLVTLQQQIEAKRQELAILEHRIRQHKEELHAIKT
jgi:site-specific recombinase XerD